MNWPYQVPIGIHDGMFWMQLLQKGSSINDVTQWKDNFLHPSLLRHSFKYQEAILNCRHKIIDTYPPLVLDVINGRPQTENQKLIF